MAANDRERPQREVKIAPRRGIPDPFKVLKLSDAPRIAREALLHLAGVAGRGVCGGGLAAQGQRKGAVPWGTGAAPAML